MALSPKLDTILLVLGQRQPPHRHPHCGPAPLNRPRLGQRLPKKGQAALRPGQGPHRPKNTGIHPQARSKRRWRGSPGGVIGHGRPPSSSGPSRPKHDLDGPSAGEHRREDLVVVVFFRALLEDLQRRTGASGIRAMEWEGSHTPIEPGHRIIFVSSERVKRGAFLQAMSQMRAKDLIGRIYLEEAHSATFPTHVAEALRAALGKSGRTGPVEIKARTRRGELKLLHKHVEHDQLATTAMRELLARAKLHPDPDSRFIAYFHKTREVEEFAAEAAKRGLPSSHYHGKMGAEERARAQRAWEEGESRVMVANLAFATGIDHPHAAGRGGRDGAPSTVLAITSERSITALVRWAGGEPDTEEMITYWREALEGQCLRKRIKSYMDGGEGEGCREGEEQSSNCKGISSTAQLAQEETRRDGELERMPSRKDDTGPSAAPSMTGKTTPVGREVAEPAMQSRDGGHLRGALGPFLRRVSTAGSGTVPHRRHLPPPTGGVQEVRERESWGQEMQGASTGSIDPDMQVLRPGDGDPPLRVEHGGLPIRVPQLPVSERAGKEVDDPLLAEREGEGVPGIRAKQGGDIHRIHCMGEDPRDGPQRLLQQPSAARSLAGEQKRVNTAASIGGRHAISAVFTKRHPCQNFFNLLLGTAGKFGAPKPLPQVNRLVGSAPVLVGVGYRDPILLVPLHPLARQVRFIQAQIGATMLRILVVGVPLQEDPELWEEEVASRFDLLTAV
ncbi:hypothetical protein BT69DRAFT_1346947, partial [Atractiella rhizophila]